MYFLFRYFIKRMINELEEIQHNNFRDTYNVNYNSYIIYENYKDIFNRLRDNINKFKDIELGLQNTSTIYKYFEENLF